MKQLELLGLISKFNFSEDPENPKWFFIFRGNKEWQINNSFFEGLKEDGIQTVFNSVEVNSYTELNDEYKKYKKIISKQKAAPVIAAAKALLEK